MTGFWRCESELTSPCVRSISCRNPNEYAQINGPDSGLLLRRRQLGAQARLEGRKSRRDLRRRSGLLAQPLKDGQPALVTKRHQRLGLAVEEAKATALETVRQRAADQWERARIILSGRAQQTNRGRANAVGILRSKVFESKLNSAFVTESREPAQSRSANRVAPRRRVDYFHQSIVSSLAFGLAQCCGGSSDHCIALIVEQLLIRIRKARVLRRGQRVDRSRAHSRIRILRCHEQRVLRVLQTI